jgi:hypothetical protein
MAGERRAEGHKWNRIAGRSDSRRVAGLTGSRRDKDTFIIAAILKAGTRGVNAVYADMTRHSLLILQPVYLSIVTAAKRRARIAGMIPVKSGW